MSVPLPPGAGIENIDPEQIKTFKEFLISYNKLTEMCFTDCISDFTSRAIKGKEVILMIGKKIQSDDQYKKCANFSTEEFTLGASNKEIPGEKCAMNCLEKFLKVNQRISQRFQEFQMLANESAIAAAQKLEKGAG